MMKPLMMRLRFLAPRRSIGGSGILIRSGSTKQPHSCTISSNNNNNNNNNNHNLDCQPAAVPNLPRPSIAYTTRGLSNCATMSSWSSLMQRPHFGPSIAFSGTGTFFASPSAHTDFSRRGFHPTALVEFPIRRTRKRSERQSATASQDQDDDDDDTDDNLAGGKRPNHAVMDPKEFRKASQALLDKIYKALLPMQAVNDPFFLSRGYDSDIGGGEYIMIDLGPAEGQYTIQVDPEQCMLIFQSPISGQHDYFLSTHPENGEWVGAQDGHNFEGLLVRDLIRQCKGLPNL